MTVWRCVGCGELVDPDHGGEETGYGHTRAEHHPACDPHRGCVSSCPVPVACGPVVRYEEPEPEQRDEDLTDDMRWCP